MLAQGYTSHGEIGALGGDFGLKHDDRGVDGKEGFVLLSMDQRRDLFQLKLSRRQELFP